MSRDGPEPSRGTPLLEIRGLTKSFGPTRALSDASLEIDTGQVHAILGENGAGKTTMMSILGGLLPKDAGEILWEGTPVDIASPQVADELGIGMVHQHDRLVPAMTVAENFALSLGKTVRLDLDEMATVIAHVQARYGGSVHADSLVADLSVGQRQWVSLLRVLAKGLRLLVLDEPTATLTPIERDVLFDALREYRDSGLSVVFITHKLDEVFAVADKVTILRHGQNVATLDVADTDHRELVRHMVGRRVETQFERSPIEVGEALLRVESLTVEGTRRTVEDVDLTVAEGEIVGIAGVDGNGQRELIEAICGIRTHASGAIRFGDRSGGWDHELSSTVARIPEDRHRHGLALGLTLWENLHLGRWHHRSLVKRGLVDRRLARVIGADLLGQFDVRTSGTDQLAGELSGGNQQKAVLARELSDNPSLVIAMNPCRGLDIAASRFVLEQLAAVRERRGGVLFVSYDLDDILSIADRILVMSSGRISGEVIPGPGADEQIGLLMGGERLDRV